MLLLRRDPHARDSGQGKDRQESRVFKDRNLDGNRRARRGRVLLFVKGFSTRRNEWPIVLELQGGMRILVLANRQRRAA
jgi:hypothetical protein